MVTKIEESWLDYAWSVVDCPDQHRTRCEVLGAAVPGPGSMDGNEVRWPGYIGRNYQENKGVLCIGAAHREAHPEEAADPVIGRTNADLVEAHRRWLHNGRSQTEDMAFLEGVRSAYEEALPHWRRWNNPFRKLIQDHLGMSISEIAWDNLAKCRGGSSPHAKLAYFCQREFVPVSILIEALRPAVVLNCVLPAKPGGRIVSSWVSPSASPLVFSFHGRYSTDHEGRKLDEWAPEVVAAYENLLVES